MFGSIFNFDVSSKQLVICCIICLCLIDAQEQSSYADCGTISHYYSKHYKFRSYELNNDTTRYLRISEASCILEKGYNEQDCLCVKQGPVRIKSVDIFHKISDSACNYHEGLSEDYNGNVGVYGYNNDTVRVHQGCEALFWVSYQGLHADCRSLVYCKSAGKEFNVCKLTKNTTIFRNVAESSCIPGDECNKEACLCARQDPNKIKNVDILHRISDSSCYYHDGLSEDYNETDGVYGYINNTVMVHRGCEAIIWVSLKGTSSLSAKPCISTTTATPISTEQQTTFSSSAKQVRTTDVTSSASPSSSIITEITQSTTEKSTLMSKVRTSHFVTTATTVSRTSTSTSQTNKDTPSFSTETSSSLTIKHSVSTEPWKKSLEVSATTTRTSEAASEYPTPSTITVVLQSTNETFAVRPLLCFAQKTFTSTHTVGSLITTTGNKNQPNYSSLKTALTVVLVVLIITDLVLLGLFLLRQRKLNRRHSRYDDGHYTLL